MILKLKSGFKIKYQINERFKECNMKLNRISNNGYQIKARFKQ